MTTEKEKSVWDLESGLPNDVDAFIANAKFGTRDEYMQQISEGGGEGTGLMFLFDLMDESGEVIGQQGYTVGSGWQASDDGKSISHPTRKNVVISSRYGQLQHRVVKELDVEMEKYGKPTDAASWNGLGFHWMLEEHETLKVVEGGGRERKQGLMPTVFVGVNDAIRGGAAPAKAAPEKATIDAGLEKQLKELAQTNGYKAFIMAAMKIEAVSKNDELMASIMDESDKGFFATHQK